MKSTAAAILLLWLAGCSQLPATKPAPEPLPPQAPAQPAPVVAQPAPPPVQPPAPTPTPPAPPPVNGTVTPEPAKPLPMTWLKTVAFGELPGWQQDDLTLAWPALLNSCKGLKNQPAWTAVCTAAGQLALPDTDAARAFFEQHFLPHQVLQSDGTAEGLITGYYEPLLHGSRFPSPKYRHPLYGPPEDLLVVDLGALYPELKNMRLRGRLDGRKVVPYFSRAEIENGQGALRGKELFWVDDPVELFFLQVQGSGRVRLETGEVARIGYADQNGHPYKSIGKWLVDKGELTLDRASMQGIKDWGRRNPERLPELLNANPSYVFFRELSNGLTGPLGSLGVPLTAERSLAVDPRTVPLGAPVWLSTTRPNSTVTLERLMLAQDTGGAIRGNVRADFFWGFGDEAGLVAGAMKQKGRMWVLLPRDYPLSRDNPGARDFPTNGNGALAKSGL